MPSSAAEQLRIQRTPTYRHDWETPWWFFEEMDREFHFELDVAASPENAKCERFYALEDDGLVQPWAPARCWMNPPYGVGIDAWCAKALAESQVGALVVGLLPSRTGTAWFHDYCWGKAEVRFIRGRIAFVPSGKRRGTSAPFDPMLVVWGRKAVEVNEALNDSSREGR